MRFAAGGLVAVAGTAAAALGFGSFEQVCDYMLVLQSLLVLFEGRPALVIELMPTANTDTYLLAWVSYELVLLSLRIT